MTKLHKGDSVVVKPGVSDADFDTEIGGWQGRIMEIKPEEGILIVHWDSVTLREMPDEMIEECIECGLSWSTYYIGTDEVVPASPRDTQADVDQTVKELKKKHAWAWIGPEGQAIQEVLVGIDPDDVEAAFETWNRHMEEYLDFPFEAEVYEVQERGPLQGGDRVTVVGISGLDYTYGVIVHVRHDRQWYDFPLYELEVVDEESPNCQLVRDYRVWFANR